MAMAMATTSLQPSSPLLFLPLRFGKDLLFRKDLHLPPQNRKPLCSPPLNFDLFFIARPRTWTIRAASQGDDSTTSEIPLHNSLISHQQLESRKDTETLELSSENSKGVVKLVPIQEKRGLGSALSHGKVSETVELAPNNSKYVPESDIIHDEDASESVSSIDWGWIPAFPHVLTASMANFMFGYHIGIMNGPLVSIAHDLKFEGDTIMEGFVVSTFLVGAFIGSVSGGVLADKIGRRRTFQIDMLPLIFGAALSASADSVYAMVIGRFLVGIGIGVNTGLVPVYISEVAPTKYRGALGSICQIGTCVGMFAVLLLGIPSETDPHWWRMLFWIAILPGILLIIGMEFSVESPRWLSKVGKWKEAESVVRNIWGEENAVTAIEELKNAAESTESKSEISWSELFTKQYYKAPTLGGILFALQQFAGINGVLYFSSLTFRDAGITNSMSASAFVAMANLLGALTALYLMDRQGRRNCLMGSYSGMAVAMGILVYSLNGSVDAATSHFLAIAGTLLYVYTFALGAGPVTALIIPELTSTRARSKTMAVSLCVHWVCNFVIGLFFLDFVERFGLSTVYGSFGIVSIVTVIFSNAFIIETKGRSLEEIEGLLNPKIAARD